MRSCGSFVGDPGKQSRGAPCWFEGGADAAFAVRYGVGASICGTFDPPRKGRISPRYLTDPVLAVNRWSLFSRWGASGSYGVFTLLLLAPEGEDLLRLVDPAVAVRRVFYGFHVVGWQALPVLGLWFC